MRATWSPRGKTPVLTHPFNWKRLSVSAVVGYSPRGDDAWLVFGTLPGSYDEQSLVEFLGQLHGHLGGDKVTIIWDGLPSHRSKLMKAYVASQRRWLVVERLPAYAPDLNPVELLWGNLKGTELANFCPPPWTKQLLPPTPACGGSVKMPSCAGLFCTTPVFLYDHVVTVLCEPL